MQAQRRSLQAITTQGSFRTGAFSGIGQACLQGDGHGDACVLQIWGRET